MKLGIGSVMIVLISSFIYSISYILARCYHKINLSRSIFSVYTIVFCNFYWLTNYGSKGYALSIFIIYISVMLIVWENKQTIIITFIIAINIILLYIIESNNPGIIPNYPSDKSRIIDGYGSTLMYLSIFVILTLLAKNNYIKQYKLAKQSDMLKSAFLANMSHEIRTPINAIAGFSKLLAKKELTKEKKENYANIIVENSNYLLQLMSDIIDISMITSGQMNISLQKLNINEHLDKLYIYCKKLIEKSGKKMIEIKTDFAFKHFDVLVDVIRLEQILTNFLSNAVKFTTEGYIKIGYYTEGKNIIFFVEDTGIGIKEEFQPFIFNRFIKGENIDNIKFERGTGIGLSLSKEIIEKLGGKIWFTSRYHEGSIFYFSLPLYAAG